jgi:ABC-type uncharacterized transport system substrate-binding protein
MPAVVVTRRKLAVNLKVARELGVSVPTEAEARLDALRWCDLAAPPPPRA